MYTYWACKGQYTKVRVLPFVCQTALFYGSWQTRSVSAKTNACIRIWKWLDMLSLGRKSGYTVWSIDNDTPQPKNKCCVFREYPYTLANIQCAKNSYLTVKNHSAPIFFRSLANNFPNLQRRLIQTPFTLPTLTDFHSHNSQMHDRGGSVQLWGGDDNWRIGSKIIWVDCTRMEKKTTTELSQSTMCLDHMTCHVITTHWQLESAGEDKYSPTTNL